MKNINEPEAVTTLGDDLMDIIAEFLPGSKAINTIPEGKDYIDLFDWKGMSEKLIEKIKYSIRKNGHIY